MMDSRPENRRLNSQKNVKAFSQSFSCGEFGAFDLDLDEDDYEAMAAEAEAAAQERIVKAKNRDAMIDGLLESEGSGDAEEKNNGDKSQLSQRGGGLAETRRSSVSKSKRWQPQQILEKDDTDEEGNDDRGVQRSDIRDGGTSSSALERNNSSGSGHTMKSSVSEGFSSRDISQSGKETFHNSKAMWEKSTSARVIKTDDESGMVLASPAPTAPNAAIHINAPNVTINYIVEQKVEGTAPVVREVSVVSDAGAFARSALRDGTKPSLDLSGSSRGADTEKGEEVPMPRKEKPSQTSDESKAPQHPQQPATNSAPPPEHTVPGVHAKNATELGLDHISKVDKDCDVSHASLTASMATNDVSRRGGQTVSTASMTASVSTSLSKNSPARKAEEKSVPKPPKVAAALPSQPHDLSHILDSLWNPANPNATARPKTLSSSQRSRSDSESSDDGSGVYTAGFTSFYSMDAGGDSKDVAKASKPSLSQIDEQNERAPNPQSTSKSEGATRRSSQRANVSKSSSSSMGAGRSDRRGSRAESPPLQQGMREEDRQNRNDESGGTALKTKPTSRRKAREDDGATIEKRTVSPKGGNMRDLLSTIASERELSVYEDESVDTDYIPSAKTKNSLDMMDQMGAIAEDSDAIVTEAEMTELAMSFVHQFTQLEKPTQGGDGTQPTHSQQRQGSSEHKRRSTSNKALPAHHKPQLARSKSGGKGGLHSSGINSHGQLMQQRSKSMKMNPQSRAHPKKDEQLGQARSKSMRLKPESNLLSKEEHADNDKPRTHAHSSRRRISVDSSQNKSYSLGDSLRSDHDIVLDTNVEKILRLEALDYVFVRRSGGRWTYAVVSEVSTRGMSFVLDKAGSKKRIERGSLLHNVRRTKF